MCRVRSAIALWATTQPFNLEWGSTIGDAWINVRQLHRHPKAVRSVNLGCWLGKSAQDRTPFVAQLFYTICRFHLPNGGAGRHALQGREPLMTVVLSILRSSPRQETPVAQPSFRHFVQNAQSMEKTPQAEARESSQHRVRFSRSPRGSEYY